MPFEETTLIGIRTPLWKIKQHELFSRPTIHHQDEMPVGKGKMDQYQLNVFLLKQYLIVPAEKWGYVVKCSQ